MAEKRLVALFDILGFRNMIRTQTVDQIAEAYKSTIKNLSVFGIAKRDATQPTMFPDHAEGVPYCSMYIFSDTIILISHSELIADQIKLIVFAWRFQQFLIVNELPVRGGISYGEMVLDPKIGIVLGTALVDAYELEQQQNWIGACFDETIMGNGLDAAIRENPFLGDLFPYYEVPFKDGTTKLRRIVNWRFGLMSKHGIRNFFHEPEADDVSVKMKIENTLAYCKVIRSRGWRFADDGTNLPTELKLFFVGDSEPPWPSGDEY
jgi:hypothetical protein